MAQKNRANMLTDIVSNIYNNLINFITGQNAQDRFVNLLDSSPNILSDASQPNGYVSTDANNEMFSSYYDEEISRADLITDLTANLAVGGKFYRINDAVGSTITLLVIAESNINLYSIGTNIATGEQGTYDITTDVFIPIVGSGNANITPIAVTALQNLQSTSAISTTTIYVVTDATPFILSMQFKANNQLYATADIMDDNYAGTVLYDSSGGTSQPIIITDSANGNIWNGLFPATTTIPIAGTTLRNTFYQGAENNVLEEDCENNIYEQDASSNTVGKYAIGNTFKQGANGFIFYEYLKNTTIEAGLTGADYTAGSYAFLYNNAYPSTIFQSGGINYHRYFDVANNRIVVTDMAIPANVTYIGGGVTSVTAGTNISVTGTSTAPIINSLSDRYKTTSVTSNAVSNGAKTFTVDADLAYIPLQEVLIVHNPSNHMHATVTSYSGTTLVVDVKTNTGSGTYISWDINLDGTPVDAITGVGTANEIAYFTGGQVIASLAVATYPSLTELSYVKGVTSAIQTQLNNKVTVFASGADGTASSGTSNTISHSQLIAANTFVVDDVIRINHRIRATGTAAIRETRVYFNTTNTLVGATLMATTSFGSTILMSNIIRHLAVKNVTTNTEVMTASSNWTTDYNLITTAVTTLAINWTADVYIIFACNVINAADSARVSMYSIEKL
jgi:hypothetical protein